MTRHQQRTSQEGRGEGTSQEGRGEGTSYAELHP